jgi:hypothetical protein
VFHSVAALALALFAGTACRHGADEPESRTVAASTPSAPAPPAVSRSDGQCALAVWANIAAMQTRPDVSALRDRVLGGIRTGAVELARASGLDIEAMTQEATLCELTGPGPRPRRAIIFTGNFPPDLLQRLTRLAPENQPDPKRPDTLRVGAGWLAASENRLVWSDHPQALERALKNELTSPELKKDGLFSVRMNRERATAAFSNLAREGEAKQGEWSSVVVSTARDGKSSEIRFVTASSEAATHFLGTVRSFLEESKNHPSIGNSKELAGLTSEADAESVSLRAAAPLEDLARLMGRLGRKPGHGHGHDHEDPPT